MKNNGIGLLALYLLISTASAGSGGEIGSPNLGGFFVGIGAAYDTLQIKSNTSAELHVISGFPPLGLFYGARGAYDDSVDRVAPMAQAGYFRSFNDNGWLWGLKFLYKNSQLEVTRNTTSIHFFNPVENVNNELVVEGFQTKMEHQLMLPLFIGHSFRNSFLYLGAGPSLQNVEHSVFQSTDNDSAFYIGNLNGFSQEKWLWGGAVQAGMAYYLNPSWFLMLDYTYSKTKKYNQNHLVSFSPEVNNGLNSGFMSFNSNQRFTTQSVSLSINKVFA